MCYHQEMLSGEALLVVWYHTFRRLFFHGRLLHPSNSAVVVWYGTIPPYHIAALVIVSSEKGIDKGGLTRTLPEKREPKRTITFIPTI